MKPFRLTAPCKDYLWGGNKLREYGKISDKDIIAESWELSCHPDGESIIADGEYAGMTLSAFLAEHPEALGPNCGRFDRFPVLVKLIDARDNLSVQVHPDDEYALAHEGEYGKTEMWYIVEAEEGAELIYGFRENVTKDEFRRAIEENTLLDKVNRVPVKKGDVFFIEAGTLHAIGKGILIAEIQQNSNTTYRVYDYGRVGADGKPRELHIGKALDVTNRSRTQASPMLRPLDPEFQTERMIGICDYFKAYETLLPAILYPSPRSFRHVLVLEGHCSMKAPDGGEWILTKGCSLFIPAGVEQYLLNGTGHVIITSA